MKPILSTLPLWLFWVLLFTALGLFGLAYWNSQHAMVKIEWTTASELNTAGFNIYRRDALVGIETRINSELIPASTDPLVGGGYQFIDNTARPGFTYIYELEDVETDGVTNRSWQTTVSVARQGFIEAGAAILLGIFSLTGIFTKISEPTHTHD